MTVGVNSTASCPSPMEDRLIKGQPSGKASQEQAWHKRPRGYLLHEALELIRCVVAPKVRVGLVALPKVEHVLVPVVLGALEGVDTAATVTHPAVLKRRPQKTESIRHLGSEFGGSPYTIVPP